MVQHKGYSGYVQPSTCSIVGQQDTRLAGTKRLYPSLSLLFVALPADGDGGDVVTITAQAVQPHQPGHWMDPGPLGTLGVGVPFAMAAKHAHPEKEVLCYFGDGAFTLTGWDLETCQRFKLPILGVIGNNSAMNQIRCGQINKYGAERGNVGNLLGDVEFEKFAEMLGGYGEAVRDPKDIRPALDRAREAVRGGTSALVNIWVDREEWAPGTRNQTMYK